MSADRGTRTGAVAGCRSEARSSVPGIGQDVRVATPFTVLFVCVGNVCRSAMAERLLRERLAERLGVRAAAVAVESAGVHALAGAAMDPATAAELERLGHPYDGFAARQLTERMLAGADLVLTATKELRSRVLEEAPGALRRTFTVTEFAALAREATGESPEELVADAARRRSSAQVEDYDIPDPIGGPSAVHREVADRLDASTAVIAEAIAAAAGRPAAEVRNP